jgi:hypothetical protein
MLSKNPAVLVFIVDLWPMAILCLAWAGPKKKV